MELELELELELLPLFDNDSLLFDDNSKSFIIVEALTNGTESPLTRI